MQHRIRAIVFYYLVMLFLSCCAYAQDVYVEEHDGKEHIVYICNNGQKVTFPARLLKQSPVLNNVVNDAPEGGRSGESRQKILVNRARWFLEDVDEMAIPVIVELIKLQDRAAEKGRVSLKANEFISPYGSKVDTELHNIFDSSPALIPSLLTFFAKFEIRFLYEYLVKYVAAKPDMWESITDVGIGDDVVRNMPVHVWESLHRWWNPSAKATDFISKDLRKFSLGHINTFLTARNAWNKGQQYCIDNVDTFNLFYDIYSEDVVCCSMFTFTPETKKLLENIFKEKIRKTKSDKADYFVIDNQPQDALELLHQIERDWRERPLYLDPRRRSIVHGNKIDLLASTFAFCIPLRVIEELFEIQYPHLWKGVNLFARWPSLYKVPLMRNLKISSEAKLNLLQDINKSVNVSGQSYAHNALFIAMANHHSWRHGERHKVTDGDSSAFFNITKAVGKNEDDDFYQILFDQSDITESSYKHYIFNTLIKDMNIERKIEFRGKKQFSEFFPSFRTSALKEELKRSVELIKEIGIESIDAFRLKKSVLQFLLHAYASSWQYSQPIALQTQEDIENCFAFNQELNKPKETHIAIAQVLRSKTLFVLSKKATDNVREKYLRKIYWRLRSKQIIKQDHLPLLRDLTLEQLNMLFRASYQPHELKEKDLDMYYQLPDVCKTEKLFDQRILDTERFLIRWDMGATRPNRLAESFANIAYSVKKLLNS